MKHMGQIMSVPLLIMQVSDMFCITGPIFISVVVSTKYKHVLIPQRQNVPIMEWVGKFLADKLPHNATI